MIPFEDERWSQFSYRTTDTLPWYTPPPRYRNPSQSDINPSKDTSEERRRRGSDEHAEDPNKVYQALDASWQSNSVLPTPAPAGVSYTNTPSTPSVFMHRIHLQAPAVPESRRHSTPTSQTSTLPPSSSHRPSQSLPSLHPGLSPPQQAAHATHSPSAGDPTYHIHSYLVRPNTSYDFSLCPLQREDATPVMSAVHSSWDHLVRILGPLQVPSPLLSTLATQPPVAQLYLTFPFRSHITVAQNRHYDQDAAAESADETPPEMGVTIGDILLAIAGYLCSPMSKEEKIRLIEAMFGDHRDGLKTPKRSDSNPHRTPSGYSSNQASGSGSRTSSDSSGFGGPWSPTESGPSRTHAPASRRGTRIDNSFIRSVGLTHPEVTNCAHPIELYANRGRTTFAGLTPVESHTAGGQSHVLWLVKLGRSG